jgi:hypothetical protein
MGYIYQIVDTKTHQYYLGKCQNTNPETDNYWGSGHNRLCRAAKKYKGTNPRYQKIVLINGISCNEKLAQLEELIISDLYQTDEYCLNLKAGGIGGSQKGRTHKPFSDETKAKISAAKLNMSDETKAKISVASKARTHSAETKAKIGAASKGRTHSTEAKAKLSAASKAKPKVQCPHCQKIGSVWNMKRWHFDNCRQDGPVCSLNLGPM